MSFEVSAFLHKTPGAFPLMSPFFFSFPPFFSSLSLFRFARSGRGFFATASSLQNRMPPSFRPRRPFSRGFPFSPVRFLSFELPLLFALDVPANLLENYRTPKRGEPVLLLFVRIPLSFFCASRTLLISFKGSFSSRSRTMVQLVYSLIRNVLFLWKFRVIFP